LQLLNMFPETKAIYCDNERSLNSETIKSMLNNNFGIVISKAPPLHSLSNGQVERFHGTLGDIARSYKLETQVEDTVENILLATIKYNRSIHSVTSQRPIGVIHAASKSSSVQIKEKIASAQQKKLDQINKKRDYKSYLVGDRVWIKNNKRLGNKLSPLFTEDIVEADLGTTVLITFQKL